MISETHLNYHNFVNNVSIFLVPFILTLINFNPMDK